MELSEKKVKIEKLRGQIAVCERCLLHKTRTHTVPGEGNLNSPLMFIGEAPGRNEDLQGKPFVGRAGQVFDQLLASVGLTREEIYLCNILKCRPPDNRNPLPAEIAACIGSLDLQIKIIDPQIIATMGNFATTYIFNKFQLPFASISAVVGKTFDVTTPFGQKKIIPLFHPAVATYNPSKLEGMKRDFQVFSQLSRMAKSIA